MTDSDLAFYGSSHPTWSTKWEWPQKDKDDKANMDINNIFNAHMFTHYDYW